MWNWYPLPLLQQLYQEVKGVVGEQFWKLQKT